MSIRLRSGVMGGGAGDELTVEYVLPLVECERTLDDDGEAMDSSKDSECGLVYNGPDGSISTHSTSRRPH